MFETEELKRYSRQLILRELGMEGQQKLKKARVLMVGAGGLGCPVLQYLVAAGAGAVGIADDDMVDISNLHRQILYTVHDTGINKSLAAKEKLGLLNPWGEIKSFPERLTEHNIHDIIRQYDVVIDGSDNFPTRYLVNDACVALNKPLVFGSVFRFEGQVSVFNYQGGPDYRDLYPEAPDPGEVPNCAETGVIGVLPGMVGTFMANEAIKVICGMGEVLSGKLLTIDALDCGVRVFKFAKTKREELPSKQEEPVCSIAASQEIDAVQLAIWLGSSEDEVTLVDVRESYEFEEYNIGGINIPLYELAARYESIPESKKLVFCCQTGQRSKMAVKMLKPLLNAELYNLKGGIYA
ncbi:HesA/MoeB/ThiF family protein [Pararcticibacter amylolyticus]|uniref:Molybdopterin-synthase adenylyltransferase n=1 Tax=Pararcticibacter amylolyticus TaxID=2173175 RepID=A0A2U2PC03_9SPHI|nr:HesA/MoeB/ThiF family protein [Pararcticibacter amylolyticus]PWG78931.1 thiamine biosynthesis protein ThiF [Pararcticibacter amylolyticus]